MKKFKFLNAPLCFVMLLGMFFAASLPSQMQVAYAKGVDEINSKAYCLMDFNTNTVLLEKESTKHLPIASVTKTMTLLLTFEEIEKGKLKTQDMLLCSKNASGMGGSQVFLDADTQYKVDDLLYAVILSSANDASVVFAEAIAGTEENFVDLMNKKAQNLGLKNTHFVNCTGLPASNHYSCANDVAVITKELLKHDMYFNYTKERLRDFVHPSGRITQMTNTNKLMHTYNGCDAGKTGSTVEAGYCLTASAVRNNLRLVSVVLGAQTSKQRFNDCATILDYGFNNYESQCLVDANQSIEYTKPIKYSNLNNVLVKPQEAYYVITQKGEQTNLTTQTFFNDIKAPLKKGEIVGEIVISNNGKEVKHINLLLTQDIPVITYLESLKQITNKW